MRAYNPSLPGCFRAKSAVWLLGVILLLFSASVGAQAQFDGRKAEIGVQFSLFRLSDQSIEYRGPVPLTPESGALYISATSFLTALEQDAGFGGRIGYNLTSNLGLEGEVDFFPTQHQRGGGRMTEAVFGLKVGGRVDHFGLFGKVRPGLMHFSELITESGSETNFALDAGAVIEYYPSQRTILRVDLGDTIVHFGTKPLPSSPLLIVATPTPTTPSTIPISISLIRPSVTTHNFQFSVGVGLRF